MASDADEMGLENEGRVRLDDRADLPVAVGEVRGNGQLALLANLHAQKTLVPALNDLALADGEFERGATVVAVIERCTVLERTTVVHRDLVAWLKCQSLYCVLHECAGTPKLPAGALKAG